MESIGDYLLRVYEEFHTYLSSEPILCKHKKLHFHLPELPDYNDPNIQQHYILRYTYAYAYDYKRMFIRCLQQNLNKETTLKILSLGCGNAIDYWSAAQAVEELKLGCRIEYTGVDICRWKYFPKTRPKDSFNFVHSDIISYLDRLTQFNQGYVIFPKSISEFSYEDFTHLRKIFRNKSISSKRFEILATFRSSENHSRSDKDRFIELVNEIKRNKNCPLRLHELGFNFFKGQDERIKDADNTFRYPDHICTTIKDLYTYCSGYQEKQRTCETCCTELLTRQPLKSSREMRYGIAPFVREIKF